MKALHLMLLIITITPCPRTSPLRRLSLARILLTLYQNSLPDATLQFSSNRTAHSSKILRIKHTVETSIAIRWWLKLTCLGLHGALCVTQAWKNFRVTCPEEQNKTPPIHVFTIKRHRWITVLKTCSGPANTHTYKDASESSLFNEFAICKQFTTVNGPNW